MLSTRKSVFLPPFIFIFGIIVVNIIFPKDFADIASELNTSLIENFGNLFIAIASLSILLCFVALFMPISKLKLGGKSATPYFSSTKYFAIVLCTTVATGILFWGSAEPIYHLQNPPLGLKPFSSEASIFALEAVFLHWTVVPYAMYSLISLMFAIGYYNYKSSFSIKSTLSPLLGRSKAPIISILTDNIALAGLILGMSASLGTGILTLSGGFESILTIEDTWLSRLLIMGLVVSAFILSAISGLQKGIKWLSSINLIIFILLASFVFIAFGPARITSNAIPSLLSFFENFPRDLLFLRSESPVWANSWSVFNWANWLAWAPMTGVFLGKIGYGLSIRKFLIFNWLLPSIFGFIWMSIFSGAAIISHQSDSTNMVSALNTIGPESLTYLILEQLPIFGIISIIFLISVFISYVTAADSNIDAMSNLSINSEANSQNNKPNTRRNVLWIKIIWGLLIGSTSLIMINSSGIDGIKILSNLGGLPAAFLMLFVIISFLKFAFLDYKKFE